MFSSSVIVLTRNVMDGRADGQTDERTITQTGKKTGGEINVQKDRSTNVWMGGRDADRQMDREIKGHRNEKNIYL